MTTLLGAAGRIDVTETLIVSLLLVASIVAIAASFLRIPYTVALVLAGLVLGLSGAFASVSLSEPIIVLVFLRPSYSKGRSTSTSTSCDADGSRSDCSRSSAPFSRRRSSQDR